MRGPIRIALAINFFTTFAQAGPNLVLHAVKETNSPGVLTHLFTPKVCHKKNLSAHFTSLLRADDVIKDSGRTTWQIPGRHEKVVSFEESVLKQEINEGFAKECPPEYEVFKPERMMIISAYNSKTKQCDPVLRYRLLPPKDANDRVTNYQPRVERLSKDPKTKDLRWMDYCSPEVLSSWGHEADYLLKSEPDMAKIWQDVAKYIQSP